jgi:hypothetical protein
VPQLNAIKVGDKVSVTYNNNVSAKVKPPGRADVDTGNKTSTGAGGVMVQRTMTAVIGALDKNTSSITFVGPNGWKYSRRVVDPTVFDKVRLATSVDISWNTDVTVKVELTLERTKRERPPARRAAHCLSMIDLAGEVRC